jgi:hypothetical protein
MERAARLAVLTSMRQGLFHVLRIVVGAVVLPAIGGGGRAAAQEMTQEQALRLAFPQGARVERRTAYLDESHLERARALAGREAEVESTVVSYYVGFDGDRPLAAAYFDAHRVRTLPEVLIIVVDPEGRLRRVQLVRFAEPPEYAPPVRWLGQFLDRVLNDDLSERRGIAGITGATLTTRAVTRAARRVLAVHAVIDPFETASP